ncbi:hypothetical protein STRMOE7_34630 [Streptomyces sp. MOE7]|nr:hypothetical protein STRMOE7_34630 [Streptomyces sp. MOE7]
MSVFRRERQVRPPLIIGCLMGRIAGGFTRVEPRRRTRQLAHRLGWSDWRRRHRARCQASHYQRQATRHADHDLRLEY